MISHGFWGSISFGKKNKKAFLLAFLFGILPDVSAFAWLWIKAFLSGIYVPTEIVKETPLYVFSIYNFSHSLIISLAILLMALFIFKKRGWVVAAWPLHILFDIPTHDLATFPTPYLWPFNTPFFPGVAWWLNSWVFYSNWILIIVLFVVWYLLKNKNKKLWTKN